VFIPGIKNMPPNPKDFVSLGAGEVNADGIDAEIDAKGTKTSKNVIFEPNTLQARRGCITSRQYPPGTLCYPRTGQCIEFRHFTQQGKPPQGKIPPGSKPSFWDRRDLDKVDKEVNAEGVDSINDDEASTAGIDAGASNNDVSEPKTLMARSYCRTSADCPRPLIFINCPQDRICIHSKYCGNLKKFPISPKRPSKGRRDLAEVDEAINTEGIDADSDNNNISEPKILMARKSCRINTDCPRPLACVIRGRSRVCQALGQNIWTYGKPPLEWGRKSCTTSSQCPHPLTCINKYCRDRKRPSKGRRDLQSTPKVSMQTMTTTSFPNPKSSWLEQVAKQALNVPIP
jgi:hypothetical protein